MRCRRPRVGRRRQASTDVLDESPSREDEFFCLIGRLLNEQEYRLLHAFKSNFQGDAGVQALESNVVRELEALTAHWARVQLLERVKDGTKVQPINPFAPRQSNSTA